jgi:putative chitinase
MGVNFTAEQLSKIIPSNRYYDSWYGVLITELPKFNIDTRERLACFLAQCVHESMGFSRLEENLNYSADALMRVFPKYFKSLTDTAEFHRNPQKIANRVYANRMGNGPESSNDGWTYRGRGLIQITGKNNYTAASKFIFNDDRAVRSPELFAMMRGAVQSAGWFWYANGCNDFADRNDFVGLTRRINGGTIGLEDRQNKYQKILTIL